MNVRAKYSQILFKQGKEKRTQGDQKNSIHITGRSVFVDPLTTRRCCDISFFLKFLPPSFRLQNLKKMKHRKTGCCQTSFFPPFIQPPAPFEGGKPFFRIERAERRYTGVLASLRLEQGLKPCHSAGTPDFIEV